MVDLHITSSQICSACLRGECKVCSDIMRLVFDEPPQCQCKLPNHSGEPRDRQILDPDTGTVYAPGLTVTRDGEVRRNE